MMAKRRRVECNKKCTVDCENPASLIDRISMLPDDLLVFILSLLTLEQAAITCVLSSRWRYLWTFVPKLDFDGTESLRKLWLRRSGGDSSLYIERRKYVRRVNRVLASHRSPTIEELQVRFDLSKTYKKSIEKWLMFALARKVQRLELNLEDDGIRKSHSHDENFTFPYKLFMKKGSVTKSINFKYIKRISLSNVNVSDEALEFLLCNCPVLEDLSISESGGLSSVYISGQFHQLKRLELSFCINLKTLEIHNSNIVYLKYQGRKIHFHLDNVPKLVEIFLGTPLFSHLKDVILMLSSHLPQLEIFTLDKDPFSWEETEMFYSSVKMSNLKQLVVKTSVNESASLLPLVNLIRASPLLQRFVLKAEWIHPVIVRAQMEKITTASSYNHLKEFEFVGYYGHVRDRELVMHLLENGVALEKVVIDPREAMESWLKGKDDIKMEMAARARAKRQLSKKVAPGVKLNIL